MPSPIAHSLAGVALYQVRPERRHQLALLALLVVAANLPDLDFIPGMIMGNADRYHHGPSHSLFVGFEVWRQGDQHPCSTRCTKTTAM